MTKIIDMRSDTVTRPTAEMRQAMAEAMVGDDVYGEDPTVNELQEKAADLLGKEAALFVPSGTMGNLISLMAHAPRGTEVILGDESHIYHYEQGGASAVGALVFHPVKTDPSGELPLESVKAAARERGNVHYAPPGVFCLENTHNRCGGTVLRVDYLNRARQTAHAIGVPIHLDGARLGNAAAALGVKLKELAEPFDSVQFDLSKGLGAPVGGVVAGSKDFILRAKRGRKLLGGGMRQAGVIAAAGIISLTLVDRLPEDHLLARRLAEALAEIKGLRVDLPSVQTNLVIVHLESKDAPGFLAGMKDNGVLAGSPGPGRVRFVLHYDIKKEDLDPVIAAARRVIQSA